MPRTKRSKPEAEKGRGYVGLVEYAAENGIPERTVRADCERGFIDGAYKNERGWWRIPRYSPPPLHPRPKRRVHAPELYDGISMREYAKKHGRSRQMVHRYLQAGRVPGAHYGPYGWDIPKDAPWPELSESPIKPKDRS